MVKNTYKTCWHNAKREFYKEHEEKKSSKLVEKSFVNHYTYHRWRESESSLNSLYHILIRPIPIWPLTIGYYLPHDYPITPHV
jgi:hypothetical protein